MAENQESTLTTSTSSEHLQQSKAMADNNSCVPTEFAPTSYTYSNSGHSISTSTSTALAPDIIFQPHYHDDSISSKMADLVTILIELENTWNGKPSTFKERLKTYNDLHSKLMSAVAEPVREIVKCDSYHSLDETTKNYVKYVGDRADVLNESFWEWIQNNGGKHNQNNVKKHNQNNGGKNN